MCWVGCDAALSLGVIVCKAEGGIGVVSSGVGSCFGLGTELLGPDTELQGLGTELLGPGTELLGLGTELLLWVC